MSTIMVLKSPFMSCIGRSRSRLRGSNVGLGGLGLRDCGAGKNNLTIVWGVVLQWGKGTLNPKP